MFERLKWINILWNDVHNFIWSLKWFLHDIELNLLSHAFYQLISITHNLERQDMIFIEEFRQRVFSKSFREKWQDLLDMFPYLENASKWSHMIRNNSMKRIIWTIINRYHYGNTYSNNNVSVIYNRFHNFHQVLYNFKRWRNVLSVPDSEEFLNSCRAKSSKMRLNSRNFGIFTQIYFVLFLIAEVKIIFLTFAKPKSITTWWWTRSKLLSSAYFRIFTKNCILNTLILLGYIIFNRIAFSCLSWSD